MKRSLVIVMISALIMTACAAAARPSESVSIAPASGGIVDLQKSVEAPLGAPAVDGGTTTYTNAQNSNASPAQDRIVIQNASLSLVVKDPQAKMNEIGALARRLGGFVVSSDMTRRVIGNNVEVPEGSINIRVPAKDLDTALDEIKANTIEVQSENRTGQDVTDKYVDLQSQLKAKQAAADKLYEIMNKTEKAEDTLMVFNQLSQVQSEIEVLKGQIKYYDEAATLSAVNVRLIAEESIQPIVIGGWQPQGEARDALQALINFFQGFVNFLIWLVILIIPVAAVLIAVLAVLWRLLRWFWRKVFPRKTPALAEKSEKAE